MPHPKLMKTFIIILYLTAQIAVVEVSSLTTYWYYSGHGGFTGQCPSLPCGACPTGQYRSGCGKTPGAPESQHASEGSCANCTQKPANSTYAAYPVGGTFSDDACPYTCNQGYSPVEKDCVLSTCPVLTENTKVYTVLAPTCAFTCKAGYRGEVETNPTTCTACEKGKFSAQGATVCTPCPDQDANGVPMYADTTGSTACSSCTLCTEKGWFKNGCGGDSAGQCSKCSL
jgi:hypothetical protein